MPEQPNDEINKTKPEDASSYITIKDSNGSTNLARIDNSHATLHSSAPPERRIGRRKFLLAGGTLVALVGVGGTALTVAFTNKSLQTTLALFLPAQTITPTPRNLLSSEVMLTINAHNDTVTNILWDPTGRYLASADLDEIIKLWDVGSALQTTHHSVLSQPLRTNTTDGAYGFNKLHWSTDGQKLVTLASGADGFTAYPRVLNAFTNNDKGQLFTNPNLKEDKPYFSNPVPEPRGDMLAAVDGITRRYLKVDLWQMSQPNEPISSLTYQDPHQFIGDHARLNIIGWSCDGLLLAGLINTGRLVIWDVKNRAIKTVIQLDDRDVQVSRITLSWSPVNPHLLAVFNIDTIAIVDVNLNKILFQLSTDDADAFEISTDSDRNWFPHVIAIIWSPDGRYIAASYARSNKVYLWDTQAKNAPLKNGLHLQHLVFPHPDDPLAHSNTITDISWSPDGRFLATGSYDKTIKVWRCKYDPST